MYFFLWIESENQNFSEHRDSVFESDNYLNRTEDRDFENRPWGSLWSGVLSTNDLDLRSFFSCEASIIKNLNRVEKTS